MIKNFIVSFILFVITLQTIVVDPSVAITAEERLEEVEKHSIKGHDSEVPHYFEYAWVEIFCKNNKKLMFHNFKNYPNDELRKEEIKVIKNENQKN